MSRRTPLVCLAALLLAGCFAPRVSVDVNGDDVLKKARRAVSSVSGEASPGRHRGD